MTSLDFSQLTDDQLVTLIREACQEAVSRNPAVATASRSAVLDESEKARIRTEASEREAARLRALERERLAKEAVEEVRRETEARESAANTERQRKQQEIREQELATEAKKKVVEAQIREDEERAWLKQAAALVERDPATISINYWKSRYGVRVLINPTCNQYDDSHLVDWNADENKIKTSRGLMARKPELIEFCAKFRARYIKAKGQEHPTYDRPGTKFLAGCDYFEKEEQSNGDSNS
jgi:hypothetical protein